MHPFADLIARQPNTQWTLVGLSPLPEEEWQRILTFLDFQESERRAMLATIETLFRRGHELVVDTYAYLTRHPETASILGWEQGADPAHLAERRRFFSAWLARLLGLDLGDDMARYLFHAGKLHAGHGARKSHVPPVFVTGSISLVHAAFARFLTQEPETTPVAATALSGWNKLLTAHLHLMQMGFNAAAALDQGDTALQITLFGKLRTVAGLHTLPVRLSADGSVQEALRKLFDYVPAARAEIFDLEWRDGEVVDSTGTPWFHPTPAHRIKPMWRVLLNGRDVSYLGGERTPVRHGDELHLFPPGR